MRSYLRINTLITDRITTLRDLAPRRGSDDFCLASSHHQSDHQTSVAITVTAVLQHICSISTACSHLVGWQKGICGSNGLCWYLFSCWKMPTFLSTEECTAPKCWNGFQCVLCANQHGCLGERHWSNLALLHLHLVWPCLTRLSFCVLTKWSNRELANGARLRRS